LVSIKYIRYTPDCVDAFEVCVLADGGHRRENLGEAPSAWARQRLGQDCAMLCFRAAAMRPGAFLERSDEFLFHPAHEQISHVLHAPIA
jgi:hypothetical protein